MRNQYFIIKALYNISLFLLYIQITSKNYSDKILNARIGTSKAIEGHLLHHLKNKQAGKVYGELAHLSTEALHYLMAKTGDEEEKNIISNFFLTQRNRH